METPPPSVPSPTRAMTGRFERAGIRPRVEEERDDVRTSTMSTASAAVEPAAGRRPGSAAARASATSIRSHATLDYTDEFDEAFDEEEVELP